MCSANFLSWARLDLQLERSCTELKNFTFLFDVTPGVRCYPFLRYSGRVCLSTLERWEPQRRFLDRWMVKTGFSQRQFRQTNEHQRYINKKLNSELHCDVEFIHTNYKILFLPPSRNEISYLTLGSRLSCLLSVNMTYRVLLLQGGKIFCLAVNTKNKCL